MEEDYLEVVVDDIKRSVSLIEMELGIKDIKMISEKMFRVYSSKVNINDISKLLIAHGVTIESMSQKKASLEEYFLKLVIEGIIDSIPGNISFDILMNALPTLIVCAFVSGFLALVPLYFGMSKKSTGRMIVTAVIVVSLTTSSMGSIVSIKAYLLRILILGVIAIRSIVLTMKYTLDNIDSVDID